jgi:ribosome-binding protein aMBF1 (putative translation factor)
MVKEKELTDKVEKVDDVVEDIVEELEDLGLIDEKLADKILAKVKLYKKYILIAIPVLVAVVVAVQSL